MPCFFCIAVVATLGATGISAAADIVDRLRQRGADNVKEVTDTESTARVEMDWPADHDEVPVAVTLYKKHGRMRIQPLTHDVSRDDAEKVIRDVARALGAEIVEWSSPEEEELVRQAFETPEPGAAGEQDTRRRFRLPRRSRS